MAMPQNTRERSGRTAIEAAGVRVIENVQLTVAYWLPKSGLVVVPPDFSESGWERLAAQVSQVRVPSPRQGE